MYSPLNKTIVDNLQVGYRVQGVGPDVLLIHGWASSGRMWQGLMDALGPRFRCWAIDLPGFGDSDKPGEAWYSIPNYLRVVGGFVGNLGLTQPILIGHSMGGMISLALSAGQPALAPRQVLLNPVVTGRTHLDLQLLLRSPLRRPMLALGRWIWPLTTSDWIDWIRPGLVNGQAAHWRRIREDWAKATPESALAALRAIGQYELASRLSQISAPTLVIVGSRDLTAPNSEGRLAARGIPVAELAVLPTGHLPTDDLPEQTQALVKGFLRAEAPGPGPRGDE